MDRVSHSDVDGAIRLGISRTGRGSLAWQTHFRDGISF